MDILKTMLIDVGSSFCRIKRYKIGDFFGPVDMGLYLSKQYNSLNIGTGLLAGSIFPGSNRLIINGFSPCWGGFYVSSMGGAGLVFNDLGLNMLSIIGRATVPSVLYLNRPHQEEVMVEIEELPLESIWNEGRKGVYSLMDYVYEKYKNKYENDPRVLAVGKASQKTDFRAIVSSHIKKGEMTYIDTWCGRGGFGSKLLQEHNIAAIIFGGTFIEEDFRDLKVADEWFKNKYQKKLAAKDIEATTKYRYDPKFNTGGTFGVNYAAVGGSLLAFNYNSIYWSEEKRKDVHQRFILDHYLKEFNEETIANKQQNTCGEPCAAVCKKMNNEYKKDYEPYQALGPLCGIFDQRSAEKVTHHADILGFDAISVGGFTAFLMDCVDKDYIEPADVGIEKKPKFSPDNFDILEDSAHNANIVIKLLDNIVANDNPIDLSEGARKYARHLARTRGKKVLDCFVYNAFARKGWVVPNQYWVPGVLSPMAIMGKYYMWYNSEFVPPRELGKANADRFKKEIMIDNMGFCRFHRLWAEEMIPEIIEELYGLGKEYMNNVALTVGRIHSRNASVYWESQKNVDFIYHYLKRKKEIDKVESDHLTFWLERFEKDRNDAAFDYWYDIHKGAHESLREY